MRLAIVNLTGGGLSEGYRKYLKNMLPRLAAHNDMDALLCLSPEGNNISSWFERPPKVDYGSCSPLTLCHLVHIPDRKMTACLRKFSPDIIFLPIARYIRFNGVPVVNMVRNMEPFVPNMKGDTPQEIFNKFIQRQLTRNSVRRTDHTIAVSGFVKEYITDRMRIPESRVSHIYHGLTPPPAGSGIRPTSIPKGWDDGFLFTCGSIRPARGLEDALDALRYLKRRKQNIRLVIAGGTVPGMRKYRAGLERRVVLSGLTDNVCWTENLNDEELRWCYDKCGLFIMTSRIEACPNIAIEALSHGAISIAADNPPLPEFFSDCAVYYEAGNGRLLAEVAADRLALEPGARSELSQRSRKRSEMFSWDATAERTLAVFKRVIQQSKGRKNRSS